LCIKMKYFILFNSTFDKKLLIHLGKFNLDHVFVLGTQEYPHQPFVTTPSFCDFIKTTYLACTINGLISVSSTPQNRARSHEFPT